MKYLFYPGCSMESSALEYKNSMYASLQALGVEVEELDNWTCCGASVAPVMSDLLGLVLPARNLALAERMDAESRGVGDGERQIIVGCSACFISFERTIAAAADRAKLGKINQALEGEGLTYQGKAQVRHLLDVLANDFERSEIEAKVKRPLTGLKVAPYYGCQTVRPYSSFDDGQSPHSMVGILEALGATVYHHLHEATCCGTALLTTKPEIGLGIVGTILQDTSPADCIVTVCPMCHMNLDSYQEKVSQVVGKKLSKMPVVFLPQLIGLAFGVPEVELLFKRHVVPVDPMLARLPV
jgi:heterodisulfide reductase subunit B2